MYKYELGFGERELDRAFSSKKLGADYFEVNLTMLEALTDEEFEDYYKKLKEENIKVPASKNLIPGKFPFIVDNPDYASIDAYLEKVFTRASKLGVKVAVLGSGAARNIPEGMSYEEGFGRFVTFVKEHVIPACKKYDIVCALENLSRRETNILNMLDESIRVVEECNSEWVRILVDFYHFANNGDNLDSVRKAGKYIVHTHFASMTTGRKLPAFSDTDPYAEYIGLLDELGYRGRLSFEAGVPDGKTFEEAGAESLELFRKIIG